MDKENNTERKFHDYGVGVYADDAERVAKVTAFIKDTFEGCAPESYVVREKAPAHDGKPRIGGTFGVALEAMKCGKGARRPGGETIWLAAKPLSGNTPFFFYENEGGQYVVHPNIFDMLAEDWEIVD